jgi:hypothetical protein
VQICCTSSTLFRPAARDDRDLDRARELQGRLHVDAGQHAVAPDVRVDERLDAVVLELLREVDDVMTGHLRPAFHRDLAVLRVQADDDVAGKRVARVVQQPGFLTAAVPMITYPTPASI